MYICIHIHVHVCILLIIQQPRTTKTWIEKKNSKNYLASLKNKKTNIQLDFYSNLPGLQLYTSQGLRYKNKLAPYQGVCLETQHYPDAPNNKNFPSTLIKTKKLYKYFTKINIS